jgi:hypothetical protein
MTRIQLKNTLKQLNNIKPYYCFLYHKTTLKKLKECKIKASCQNCLYRRCENK